MKQNLFESMATDGEKVAALTLEEKVARAIKLLQDNEPEDGYYLAFSGGKDSCVIKELAKMSGVKFDAWYSCTTIDPPELVRFIKEHHKDVKWNMPKYGNMMARVANKPSPPPTRSHRWCCSEYKENHGAGRTKIFGVRAFESKARAERWRERMVDTSMKYDSVCPIVYWKDSDVWQFLNQNNVPYCSLYDEGFHRLGCVGCPLASKERQIADFKRWPAFGRNWKNAIIKNWEKYKDNPRRDGKPRMHSYFKTGEEFWNWWIGEKSQNPMDEDCQTPHLWTNHEDGEL